MFEFVNKTVASSMLAVLEAQVSVLSRLSLYTLDVGFSLMCPSLGLELYSFGLDLVNAHLESKLILVHEM